LPRFDVHVDWLAPQHEETLGHGIGRSRHAHARDGPAKARMVAAPTLDATNVRWSVKPNEVLQRPGSKSGDQFSCCCEVRELSEQRPCLPRVPFDSLIDLPVGPPISLELDPCSCELKGRIGCRHEARLADLAVSSVVPEDERDG
jgi:hypothetical protein